MQLSGFVTRLSCIGGCVFDTSSLQVLFPRDISTETRKAFRQPGTAALLTGLIGEAGANCKINVTVLTMLKHFVYIYALLQCTDPGRK